MCSTITTRYSTESSVYLTNQQHSDTFGTRLYPIGGSSQESNRESPFNFLFLVLRLIKKKRKTRMTTLKKAKLKKLDDGWMDGPTLIIQKLLF